MRRLYLVAVAGWIVALGLHLQAQSVAPQIDADVLLSGGMLHLGDGAAAQRGNVAIVGDTIVAVGQFAPGKVGRTIDCTDLIVSPGFIDLHNHSDQKVVSLEQAIRSSSGLPADILQLKDRGYLRVGYRADVIVWDPFTFIDTATYNAPHQYAQGVKHGFVNGEPAIADGYPTGVLAGKPLRHHSDKANDEPNESAASSRN